MKVFIIPACYVLQKLDIFYEINTSLVLSPNVNTGPESQANELYRAAHRYLKLSKQFMFIYTSRPIELASLLVDCKKHNGDPVFTVGLLTLTEKALISSVLDCEVVMRHLGKGASGYDNPMHYPTYVPETVKAFALNERPVYLISRIPTWSTDISEKLATRDIINWLKLTNFYYDSSNTKCRVSDDSGVRDGM